MLRINDLTQLYLGIQGENKSRTIVIDVADWLVSYPNGSLSIWIKRPGDATATATGAVFDAEEKTLTWQPDAVDTYVAGEGTAEIRLTEGTVIKKTREIRIAVSPAVTGGGTTLGSDWQSYINEVDRLKSLATAAATAAEASALDAEEAKGEAVTAAEEAEQDAQAAEEAKEAAVAAKDGIEEARDAAIAAKNAAEGSATAAAGSATAAAGSATAAAGSATAAEGSATAAAGSATSAAENAETAENAKNAAVAAKTAAEAARDVALTMIDDTAGTGDTDKVWSADKSAAEVTDLKDAIKTVDGSQIETDWSIGYAYKTASSVSQIQPTDKTATTNFACISVVCSEGDVFYLTGKGGGAEKLWVWLKSDGTIIDRANSNAEEESIELIAPYQAAYLLCSVYTTQKYFLVSGASVDYKVNVIDGKLTAADEKNKATNYESNKYNIADVYYGTVGSGTTLQVRKSTTSYNGLIIPIPRGIQTIDLSDMTPYYIHAFSDYPVIGATDGVQLTVTNKIVNIPVDNEYEYAIVTINRSASGNNKDVFTISMKKTFDERIRNLEYKINPIKSGRTLPIVCFLYDDNPSGDTTLHDMLEERGLKGTFATIGNVDKDDTTWKTTATRLQEWVRQGHGVVGHGPTVGVDVTILDGDTLPGLSNISDADARKAIEANNAALDAYGLPHNGIAYWNVWEDSPHTRAIVEKYYNYGFTFGGGGSGPNTLMTDLFRLTRWTTDLASHMKDAVDYVNETIGQNRLLVFGGHMNRTGTGTGSYSTMSQFTSLLNAARDAVRNGDMISLNTDDAIRMFYGQNGNAGILSGYPYRPAVGNMVYDNGLKVCTNSGKAAFYRLTFSGTPQAGKLTIPEINIDVTVNASDTITDVVNRIISGTMCRNYTLEKTSSTQVYCYCDKSGAMDVPTVDVNTSGLTVAIVERQTGVNPVWS